MPQIFAYITHKNGIVDDSAQEMICAIKKSGLGLNPIAIVTGFGKELDLVCKDVSLLYGEVWRFDHSVFSYPNAEIVRKLIINILPSESYVFMTHDTFGMDLAPGLAIKLSSGFVSDVVDFSGFDGDFLKIVRQEYGGMVSVNMLCDVRSGCVLTLRPGCFQICSDDKNFDDNVMGKIVDKTDQDFDASSKREFLEIVSAESGDVDITKADMLVSVGRGIEDEDNIEIAQELADAMGAVVSCSRPIVDAKWMEKSRQVGTSGQIVKPKVYLACGISGSFQHMGGIKGAAFIVAINKNPKAPIFQVADIGIEADILDFLPDLTEKINNS